MTSVPSKEPVSATRHLCVQPATSRSITAVSASTVRKEARMGFTPSQQQGDEQFPHDDHAGNQRNQRAAAHGAAHRDQREGQRGKDPASSAPVREWSMSVTIRPFAPICTMA